MTSINFNHRKRARKYALQALYGWQLSGNELGDLEKQYLEQHDSSKFDCDYFRELLYKVPVNIVELDGFLGKFSEIPVEEFDPITLSVLRIAAYELKYKIDIPYRVIINEALDLMHKFGAQEGHKFVNGVLDKLAKELREIELGR